MTRKKWILVGCVVAAVGLFFLLGGHRHVTLEALKSSRESLLDLYDRRPLATAGVYFGLYVLVTALSLPAATILTLAGGAVFGLATGTLLVSFASSIGATLACAGARHLFRDAVMERFGSRLAGVHRGVETEGAFYLFTMRLLVVIPFMAVNLLMGLTRMSLRTFYWVSQLGMLPATLVYVNAGRELGKLESLRGILSPQMLVSMALLGFFPLIAKGIVARVRAKRSRAVQEQPNPENGRG